MQSGFVSSPLGVWLGRCEQEISQRFPFYLGKHIVGYYSDLKRNEILIQAITWMDLENITLSEDSHTQKQMLDNSIYGQYPE